MSLFVTRTVGDVVSEIRMSRTAFGGSLLVVEGDDDVKFWRRWTAGRDTCQLVLAGGKPTVTNAVVKAGQLNLNGILGVVDDDYDSLLGRSLPSPNLIRTEARDLETLMLSTPALDRVLNELGDAAKMRDLEQREGRSIREAFVSRSLIFGQLRYLNAAEGWNVAFEDLSPYRFADDGAWTFDTAALFQEFVQQTPGLTVANLEVQMNSLTPASPWSLLHGKDSLKVLAVGLRKCIGQEQHPPDRLLKMLRLAFDPLLFRDTQLHAAVRTWEAANSPYRVLAS